MIRLTFETSGTTGEPKRIEHTFEAMEANAKAFNEAVGLGRHTVMYHCLPRTHMAGYLNTILCPVLAGGRVVFGPTFSAATAAGFWADLQRSAANTIWITPTIAAMLLRLNRQDRGYTRTFGARLHHVFCGTAPLPSKVRRDWLDTFGIALQESYGTSEHMLVSVQSREQALIEHNVGSVLPGIRIHYARDGGLLVSSRYSEHGCRTGDIGELRDGRLAITGRLKDLIKRGGVAVAPVQIEEVARKVAGVTDAAAVGQLNDFWGESIVLFVEGGDKVTVAEHCRAHLPKSHWPDVIEVVDKLPRNPMGKVQKRELVSRLAA